MSNATELSDVDKALIGLEIEARIDAVNKEMKDRAAIISKMRQDMMVQQQTLDWHERNFLESDKRKRALLEEFTKHYNPEGAQHEV